LPQTLWPGCTTQTPPQGGNAARGELKTKYLTVAPRLSVWHIVHTITAHVSSLVPFLNRNPQRPSSAALLIINATTNDGKALQKPIFHCLLPLRR
jgi:hypothetical protein